MRRFGRALIVGFVALDLAACAALIDLQEPTGAATTDGGLDGSSPVDSTAPSNDANVNLPDSQVIVDSGPVASGHLDDTFGPDGGRRFPGLVAFAPHGPQGDIAYVITGEGTSGLTIFALRSDGSVPPALTHFSFDGGTAVPGAIEATPTGVVAVAMINDGTDIKSVAVRAYPDVGASYDVGIADSNGLEGAALGVVGEPPYAALYRAGAPQQGWITTDAGGSSIPGPLASSAEGPQLALARAPDGYAAGSLISAATTKFNDYHLAGSILTANAGGGVQLNTSGANAFLLLGTDTTLIAAISTSDGVSLLDVSQAGAGAMEFMMTTVRIDSLTLHSGQIAGDKIYLAGCVSHTPWIARFVRSGTSFALDNDFNRAADGDGGGVVVMTDYQSACAESVRVDSLNHVYVLVNHDSDTAHENAVLFRFGQ